MQDFIKIRGAKEHNLKNVDIDIPKNKMVVITGLSGSGKSSLAFDTIYAEGQRRYVESLSFYARQFLHLQNKPNVESISGLSPSIAIDQKTTSKNPRSTVGTLTEVYDYMRLLYARVGIAYSPYTGLPITSQTISQMVDIIMQLPNLSKIHILAPIVRKKKGEFKMELLNLKRLGYKRVIIDQKLVELNSIPLLQKTYFHDIEVLVDRVQISENLGNRLAESLESALDLTQDLVYVQVIELPKENNSEYFNDQRIVLSKKFACPESGFQLEKIEPRLFSFNSPFGACPECEGIGNKTFFDEELIVPNKELSINEGAIAPWGRPVIKSFINSLHPLVTYLGLDLTIPFKDISENIQKFLFYGIQKKDLESLKHLDSKTISILQHFPGIINGLCLRFKKDDTKLVSLNLRDELNKYTSKTTCFSCKGFRLKKEALCVKIDNFHIGELSQKKIFDLYHFFLGIKEKLTNKQSTIGESVIREIISRLKFLVDVGLEYLSLSREAGSLSGGEAQRIRLASQIGSGLSGVLYVLDEPSIGLHQRDNDKLIKTLFDLKDLGNSVIVVEHDEETMLSADYIIDVGPAAGRGGGEIVFQGSVEEIKNATTRSITAQYLTKKQYIEIPSIKRTNKKDKKYITLLGANANNLRDVDLSIQLGTFNVITGVSGSGKSTLIIHTLYNAVLRSLHLKTSAFTGKYREIKGLNNIDKVIDINQSPIGRTPRSNPATYTGVFSYIRDWFVELPEARIRGYKVGRFSFNVPGGRCESCQGDGLIKIEMHFLPDVYIVCEECNGKRYNRETLEIKYNKKNISDILDMTVSEAVIFFKNIPQIYEKLITLQEVGLEYLKIGQSATTLSGGEAQRIKLAKELSKKSTGRTLYILDEPTTGLHTHDVKHLLKILHKLVDKGNTVIVIEHNMEVIKTADYIIDVGPEGGDRGGKIVAQGTVEDIIRLSDKSYTGKFLKEYLERNNNIDTTAHT